MPSPDPRRPIGRYLVLQDLCTCTNTWKRFASEIDPYPASPESVQALEDLAVHLLDAILDHFGRERFVLTYGFCSVDLRRRLKQRNPDTGKPFGRVAPRLDQHMACERRQDGEPCCPRLGAACDFRIRDLDSRDLVDWILDRGLPFDRLYFYTPDRPIHLSYGPEHSRDIWTFGPTDRPTRRGVEAWVERARRSPG